MRARARVAPPSSGTLRAPPLVCTKNAPSQPSRPRYRRATLFIYLRGVASERASAGKGCCLKTAIPDRPIPASRSDSSFATLRSRERRVPWLNQHERSDWKWKCCGKASPVRTQIKTQQTYDTTSFEHSKHMTPRNPHARGQMRKPAALRLNISHFSPPILRIAKNAFVAHPTFNFSRTDFPLLCTTQKAKFD